MHYNFKKITVVPTSKDFVDIVLSKTQRKNPTVVHKSYDIGRLRSFYKRKIKFAQQTFHDKLASIISEFPKLDDVHPFYSDLMNILYDKDHYKLALGQVNQSMHLIDRVAKRNVTLLKHAASLFQCKRLKIASLGMMVKVVKKNAASFKYLEEVRQHLSRLPSIDPNTRTLLLCGFPNVGKSSFINKITRADVDVQPYAFTTKSLFVGHTDYHTLRYQVIDTPGLLDRQLEDRNTIEMQAITALAHLRAHVIFIMDPSEQCGFNMQAQLDLFNSMRPLFASKPKMVVLNKCDVREMGELDENYKSALAAIEDEGIKVFQMSTLKELGISEVKNHACSALLEFRVEAKMKMKKVTDVMNRLHVAMPENYNPSARPPSIPENALKKKNSVVTQKKRTEKDISVEQGRDYHLDLNKNYLLKDQEWRYDVMPVFMDGHNVADFIDPEMDKKMEELEAEERMREEAGMYDDEEEEEDEEAKVVRKTAAKIRERKIIAIMESREKRRVKASTMPRTGVKMDTGAMVDKLATVGVEVDADDHETHLGRARSRSRQKAQTEKQSRKRHRDLSQSQSLARSQSRPPPRDKSGVRDEKMAAKAKKLVRIGQRERNRLGKVGESDRQIATKKPRHLYSGKRKMGKTDRR